MKPAAIAAGITASLALAVPASAHAGDLTAQPWARAGIDAAVKHWGDWPRACPAGGIRVTAAPLDSDTLGEVPRVTALVPSDCEIRVAKWLLPMRAGDAEFACDLIVHEYGHLLGWEHPDDPSTDGTPSSDPVMAATLPTGTVRECRPKPAAKRKVRVKVKRAKAHRYHVVN